MKLTKQEGILVKVESTPGIDAVPDAANNSVMVEDIGWSFAGARMLERSPVKSTLGKLRPVFAGTLMEMTFKAELKGSGVAGTAPEFGALLRACAMDETIVASTSVTYSGISTGHEYCTIYYYEDGGRYVLTGCQGDVELTYEAGGIPMLSFTMTGHLSGPVDAALVSFQFDATVPSPFVGASFSSGGFGYVIDNLSFGPSNQIVTPNNPNSADGYGQIVIVDKDYGGSFDPQATLIATADPIGDWKGGISRAITTGVIGSVAGNRSQLTIPTSVYRELGPGDRDGIRTYDIGYMAEGDDSAFSLAFT